MPGFEKQIAHITKIVQEKKPSSLAFNSVMGIIEEVNEQEKSKFIEELLASFLGTANIFHWLLQPVDEKDHQYLTKIRKKVARALGIRDRHCEDTSPLKKLLCQPQQVDGNTPLILAVAAGDPKLALHIGGIIRKEKSMQLNYKGESFLHFSNEKCSYEQLRNNPLDTVLTVLRFNPDKKGNLPVITILNNASQQTEKSINEIVSASSTVLKDKSSPYTQKVIDALLTLPESKLKNIMAKNWLDFSSSIKEGITKKFPQMEEVIVGSADWFYNTSKALMLEAYSATILFMLFSTPHSVETFTFFPSALLNLIVEYTASTSINSTQSSSAQSIYARSFAVLPAATPREKLEKDEKTISISKRKEEAKKNIGFIYLENPARHILREEKITPENITEMNERDIFSLSASYYIIMAMKELVGEEVLRYIQIYARTKKMKILSSLPDTLKQDIDTLFRKNFTDNHWQSIDKILKGNVSIEGRKQLSVAQIFGYLIEQLAEATIKQLIITSSDEFKLASSASLFPVIESFPGSLKPNEDETTVSLPLSSDKFISRLATQMVAKINKSCSPPWSNQGCKREENRIKKVFTHSAEIINEAIKQNISFNFLLDEISRGYWKEREKPPQERDYEKAYKESLEGAVKIYSETAPFFPSRSAQRVFQPSVGSPFLFGRQSPTPTETEPAVKRLRPSIALHF